MIPAPADNSTMLFPALPYNKTALPLMLVSIVLCHIDMVGGSSEMRSRAVSAFVLALLLTGCADAASGANKSPFYEEGFGDGCATASAQGTPGQTKPVRDQALFDRDNDYHAGWISGLAQCRMPAPQTPLTR